MSKQIGVLGTGAVGVTLAKGLRDLGYEVEVGSRSAHEIDNWDGVVDVFGAVAARAEIVVLAVKGSAAQELVKSLSEHLANKTIIDTTNPISEVPPENGVLNFFTSLNSSLMEQLQDTVPSANFVKAFNCVGAASMVNPNFREGKPTMFICGNNNEAKQTVKEILEQFNWEIADMGEATAARAIEPLCMLWCIPGILHNDWSHAFKLLQS